MTKCTYFKQIKEKKLKPTRLLQEIQIPLWKWEDIKMDFVVCLPQTLKSYDSIWVVVDRLTMSVHFILVKSTYPVEDYPRIFIDEIVCRHGISLSIISNRGVEFTSRF